MATNGVMGNGNNNASIRVLGARNEEQNFSNSFFGTPAMQQLVRGLVQPKFSGRRSDWSQVENDWERY